MRYVIAKTFDAHVAHRINIQCLYDCMRGGETRPNPCLNIHGHSAQFIVELSANELVNEMVLDYNHINFIKQALNEHYDHRFTMSKSDALYSFLIDTAYRQLKMCEDVQRAPLKKVDILSCGDGWDVHVVDIAQDVREANKGNPIVELLDSFTLTDFTTTSENLAHWMYQVVVQHLNRVRSTTTEQGLKAILENVKVESVSYKESAKSIATYRSE